MKILITGGAGFIGSHTLLCLLERGYDVIVLDSFCNSSPKSIDGVLKICEIFGIDAKNKVELIDGDIRNKKLLHNIFLDSQNKGVPIFGVIHFAGLKSVKKSIENPILYWDVNVSGTINLLNVMSQHNCKNIVFSSSATIYGNPNNYINEDHLISPINPYGSTKFAVETLLANKFKSDSSNWRIANLRYFNPIGAHKSGLIGEDPKGVPDNIFPFILKVATGEFKKLRIYGNDWPTNDGTGVRDYIHVMDLAEAHIRTFEFLIKNKPQLKNINIGTGIGTSVLELINAFKEVNHIEIPYTFSGRRAGDASTVVANNNLAKDLLGWIPKKDIFDMCKDGWNWKKLNPDGFN